MSTDTFDWFSLIAGLQFVLGLQLLVVAGIHFVYPSRTTRIPLAALCLIHGLWFFKRVFYGYWEDSFLLFVLIGPGKPIFAGTLLLFYYRLYTRDLPYSYLLRHLTVPGSYYGLILLFRFFLIDASPVLNQALSLFFTASTFLIFGYYFLITRRELNRFVRLHLVPKAYRKMRWLFYSIYFFLLQVPLWDMLKHVIENRYFLISVGEHATYIYLHLLGYFLFLYAVSELPFFRRTFLPRDVGIRPKVQNEHAALKQLIHHHLIEHKQYKDPDLSLATFARSLGVSQRDLADYLKLGEQGSFKNWVNRLRVAEFKRLSVKEEFTHYDLVGLALECGFRSKSTFFRVFKQLEGKTPNQLRTEQT